MISGGNGGTNNNNSNNVGGGGGGGGGPPCGACKFLRRKCVKGSCIFAPYFDSEQGGTAHFAAVHKVFGASNASKLLLRIPPNKRLDAVVSLCYEALSRVRDPVYGSVAHIFTLQQQVINLQAELAIVQARLSILQRLPFQQPQPQSPNSLTTNLQSSPPDQLANSNCSPPSMHPSHLGHTPIHESAISFCDNNNPSGGGDQGVLEDDDDELETLAREFVASYFPAVKFR